MKFDKALLNNILRVGLVVGVAVFLLLSAIKGEIITPDIDLNAPQAAAPFEAPADTSEETSE